LHGLQKGSTYGWIASHLLEHFFAQPCLYKHLIGDATSLGKNNDSHIQIRPHTHVQWLYDKGGTLYKTRFFVSPMPYRTACVLQHNSTCSTAQHWLTIAVILSSI